MCYEISCHKFLSDYFRKHPDKTCVSLRQINNVISAIEEKLNDKIRINVTRDSLSSVINSSAGNVELEFDNRHIKVKGAFLTETSDPSYEDDLPSDLQEKYTELLVQA